MSEAGPAILVVVCLSSEDDPDEQFLARDIVRELAARHPDTAVVLPDEARTPIWDELDRLQILSCRYLAVTLGTIAAEIAQTAEIRRIQRVLLLGPANEALAASLAKMGLDVAALSAASTRLDAAAPAPVIDAVALDRDEARRAIGMPEDHFAVLCPAVVGVSDALDIIDRLARCPISAEPLLLVFSDRWNDRERLMQRAALNGLKGALSFCGEVPLGIRASLVAAFDAVVCPHALGAFEGYDSAFAAQFGRQILRHASKCDRAAPMGGENTQRRAQEWMLFIRGLWDADGPPAVRATCEPQIRIASSVLVVMPTFECRPFLRQAIASVLDQSHPHTHLVVVDDSGSDVDADLIRDHPDVTFLRSPGRIGPYAIANNVIAATQSDLVAFHDADDESTPERLAAQVDRLVAHRFDAVGSNSRIVDLCGALIGVEVRPVDASLQMQALGVDMILHPTSLLRRSLFDDIGGFDASTRFGADTEFHLRAALGHDIGNVSEFLYVRRQRPASLTQSRQTGFGSQARVDYNRRVGEAFRERLGGGRQCTESGTTLYGARIPAPDLDALTVLSAGQNAQRWLSARLLS